METTVKKRLINAEEYYQMGMVGLFQPHENVELINGEIFSMSLIGSRHAAVVDQLSDLFKVFKDLDMIVRTQNPIQINQWNEPEPDIALLNFRQDYYASAHPTAKDVQLIAEVSECSLDFDRKTRLPLYAAAGIPSYWIIDLKMKTIEVMEAPEKNQYTRQMKYFPGDQIIFYDTSFDVSTVLLVDHL